METLLVFLTLSVFIIGGIVIVQLYVLRKKRKEMDATRARLEEMLVRDCGHAISRYRMQFFRLPKNEVGYLTRVSLSHETNMPEFYLAFGDSDAEVLGYARFTRKESKGHKHSYMLTEVLPASAPVPCPVLSLHNELYTLDEAVSTRETIDAKLDRLIGIRVAEAG
ncbi:hypothetical protein [Oxalobacter paraformigenes]|uniref:Uncharacterized protein n=1 Tax=Oxalobacter paraformigenes TaxID=556268 RepID=C3X2K3_9BURK|nr:hypothetical protein [Oxalobacter paraformigenes]EEO27439.1 hypothetical protein OFAG_00592 [Oxalobacter paraformigenes]